VTILGLCLVFSRVLGDWLQLSWSRDLFSHLPLIPGITVYLIATHKTASGEGWRFGRARGKGSGLPDTGLAGAQSSLVSRSDAVGDCPSSEDAARPAAIVCPVSPVIRSPWWSTAVCIPLLLGGIIVIVGWRISMEHWSAPDRIAYWMTAFVCWLIGALVLFLGPGLAWKHQFALWFLFFMVPFPDGVVDGIEVFFQHTSAWAARGMLALGGMTMLVEGLSFQLPGITLVVAQECSGIRSSLVLFIVSLVAGHLFLRSPWKRAGLALFVIPLAIVRNGFRIFTIAMLCVHVGPEMIHSTIHRKGGPLFFIVSLVPFFAVLLWLRKTEPKAGGNEGKL
jgi:exosortase C (VPDSG-CTERM-specific)